MQSGGRCPLTLVRLVEEKKRWWGSPVHSPSNNRKRCPALSVMEGRSGVNRGGVDGPVSGRRGEIQNSPKLLDLIDRPATKLLWGFLKVVCGLGRAVIFFLVRPRERKQKGCRSTDFRPQSEARRIGRGSLG